MLYDAFLYSIFSLSISLMYFSSRVINFALPDILTFGVFVSQSINISHSYFVGGIASSILNFLVFSLLYYGNRKGLNPLSQSIITVGVAFIIQSITTVIWGAEPRSVSPFQYEKFVFIIPIFVFLLLKTKYGVRLRASAESFEKSKLFGIKVIFTVGLSWGITAFLSLFPALIFAEKFFLEPYYLFDAFLKGFAGSVLGGLESPFGAMIGGIIVSILEYLFGIYISIEFKSAFTFSLIILSLIIRPEGIFGKERKERV